MTITVDRSKGKQLVTDRSEVSCFAIETVSGALIDFARPDPEAIRLSDIAHGLSHTCRFGGHTKRYYSVAEHAVLVHDLVARQHPELAGAALHHDDHEAFIGDLPTPLKKCLGPSYRALVVRLDNAIGEALGIDPVWFHHPVVKEADQLAMQIEAAQLMPPDWPGADGKVRWPGNIAWYAGRQGYEAARSRYMAAAIRLAYERRDA